jgi:hypothetical protein
MICADFLAGANLDSGNSETVLLSMKRFFGFRSEPQKQELLQSILPKVS